MTVCILGNSLTAFTLAKALVNCKINVEVLYNKRNYKINDTRTIGIAKNNINFFNNNIINIQKIIWNIKKIEIFSENPKKTNLINFEKSGDQLFSIVKNYELYNLLKKKLSENKFFKAELVKDINLSSLKNYELIINCDPSNLISKQYFSKKIVKNYNSYAYTTLITHEKIKNDTALQFFTNKGPLAFLPISDKQTSIVYSFNSSDKQKEENIKELIIDKNFRYKIISMDEINSFELKSLNLRSYYHNNILAFGDLLHKVHPLAGQGFNMSIRDIKILLEIIVNKLGAGLSLDSSVNLEFQKRQKHQNFIFSTGVDFIHECFNIETKFKTSLISKSVKLISNYPSINKMFSKIADRGVLF